MAPQSKCEDCAGFLLGLRYGSRALSFEFEEVFLQVTVPESVEPVAFHFLGSLLGSPTFASHPIEPDHVSSAIGAAATMDKQLLVLVTINDLKKALDDLGGRESAGSPRKRYVLHSEAFNHLPLALSTLTPVAEVNDDLDALSLELFKTFPGWLAAAVDMTVDGVKIRQTADFVRVVLRMNKTSG